MKITLNHIYLVLLDKTYRSVTGSDFLRTAFPGMERRTTLTAAGESWFGTYYYGFDNYLEFFSDWAGHWIPQAEEGWGGLAFSSDEPGGVETVQALLRENFGYEPYRTLRQFQDGSNWFHYVSLAETVGQDSLDAWVMEYHPDIFAQRSLPVGPNGELKTEDYLSAWNQPRKPVPGTVIQQPVFKRIINIDVCLQESAAAKLARILALLGYAHEARGHDHILSAHGTTLCLSSPTDAGCYTIRSLKLEMTRPSVSPATFVFSPGSRLTLNEDLTADWFFGE